ncbi:hypothetical protein BKA62DRAFT_283781 [Auriculariales sp. MPI-PUGE-AT-0066]|nr:hypothetical protein BKA62DRAFT_283781 [Auriculariales sp. MPI-PUGE-AT-0066]
MQICRAEDGERFQVNAGLDELERVGLEVFLHDITGVPPAAVIAFLADGRRLRADNIREIGVHFDSSIVVFNQTYLDMEPQDALARLSIVPTLQDEIPRAGPVNNRLSALLAAGAAHHDFVSQTLAAMQVQHEATRVACAGLDINVLNVTDTFDAFAEPADRELKRQAGLLAHRHADLEIVVKIRVHVEFLSVQQRAGGRPRVLGDWIDPDRMRQVGDRCAEVHDDLQRRFAHVRTRVVSVMQTAENARASTLSSQLLDDADHLHGQSHDAFDRMSQLAAAVDSGDIHPGSLTAIEELDTALRRAVVAMADIKNQNTSACLEALRTVSSAHADLLELPLLLTSLQTDFRSKAAWQHLQRCHNMLYAYGATLIEIVRRKEFAQLFSQRAQTMAEVMARFSAIERKRRQVYRSEVQGQLPFETRGFDDPVPTLDMSTAMSGSGIIYELERADVHAYMRFVEDLEINLGQNESGNPVTPTRLLLEKSVQKMENLEMAFDKMAERSILSTMSSSRVSQSRQSSASFESEAGQNAHLAEHQQQIDDMRQARLQQDQLFSETRLTLEADITRLRAELDAASTRAESLQSHVNHLTAQHKHEQTARQALESRRTELSNELERGYASSADQKRATDMLRRELEDARGENETLRADHETTLRNLETARARGENLEAQIHRARTENDDANVKSREKERMLRAQATEADRQLRDHIAEADGDRAVLEQQFHELQARLETESHQLKEARAETEILQADLAGLKEELAHANHAQDETRHTEDILREDLQLSNRAVIELQSQVGLLRRTVTETLEVAVAFRESHIKALQAARTAVQHGKHNQLDRGPGSLELGMSAIDSLVGLPTMLSRNSSTANAVQIPSDAIDINNPQAALRVLTDFDLEAFAEAIQKTGSTIRKWQKQCKEYRERARGKITFRNFAKGDLALFLPTRNSVAKPWAAFNVSFPHYFLKPSGHIAEQIKSREWIVARITSITERIVNSKDPSTNPYGLGDGIKFYMLEVEDWTSSMSPSSSSRRRTSSRRIAVDPDAAAEADDSALQPAEEAAVLPSPPGRVYPTPPHRPRGVSTSLAGPSSLSKLLAQNPSPPVPPSHQPTALSNSKVSTDSEPPGPLIRPTASPTVRTHPLQPGSPLRPASRSSTTSRPSSILHGARPFLQPVTSSGKAAPTIAVTERHDSPPSTGSIPNSIQLRDEQTYNQPHQRNASTSSVQLPQGTPSPDVSASEGMSGILRSRTLSRPAGPAAVGIQSAGSALANLANSWGVAIGRRRKPTTDATVGTDPNDVPPGNTRTGAGPSGGRVPSAKDVFRDTPEE